MTPGKGQPVKDGRTTIRRRTDHGIVTLLPDVDSPARWLLTINGVPQSYVDLDDPCHLEFEYVQRLGHLIDLCAPPSCPLRALHLGGGGMTVPRYIAATRPGSTQWVAERDAALVELVRDVLPWKPARLQVTVADARDAMEQAADASADLVIADVFAGSRIPPRVTSVEFARHVARGLALGGLYAANIADGAALDFTRGQVATIGSVLPQVCLITEPAVLRGRRFGNVVLVAARRPLPLQRLRRVLAADPFPARVVHGADLRGLLDGRTPVIDAAATGSPPPPRGAFELP